MSIVQRDCACCSHLGGEWKEGYIDKLATNLSFRLFTESQNG